jgi:catechol 2,3-dioxygenase-like lactoylglutathione lyase family enzyme
VLLTIQVESVDETYGALQAKGVAFDVGPTDRAEWGARTAHFRDPDGNLLELFQHIRQE